jgi:Rhodopirellula transposase DDE domain
MTIAGLPQDKDVKWTHLSQRTICDNLANKNHVVSRYHVKKMLKFRQYKKRALLKKIALKDVEGRNEQFEQISTYRTSFTEQGLPVLSIDTKKKELIGNFSRAGTAYSTSERQTKDHDFLSSAEGQIVPHGIYDINDNTGYVTLGISKDTSEFVCDNFCNCWTETLQYKYPDAETILLLCDGGGSNASAHYIVKQDLVKLAKSLNINILVAHYPPYCSKRFAVAMESNRTSIVFTNNSYLVGRCPSKY